MDDEFISNDYAINNIGKIHYDMIFDGQVFNGIDVSASYIDVHGRPSLLKFHYAFFSTSVYVKTYEVLTAYLNGKEMPAYVTNVISEYL